MVRPSVITCSHHVQLNWLYFCGICQLMPLKLWQNTAQGCNHQSTCMPQLQPLCSAALVLMYYPKEWRLGWALCSDRCLIVYWTPLRIRTRAAGLKIISGDHYTTTALFYCSKWIFANYATDWCTWCVMHVMCDARDVWCTWCVMHVMCDLFISFFTKITILIGNIMSGMWKVVKDGRRQIPCM